MLVTGRALSFNGNTKRTAECRFVRGILVGNASREADLWDFCGARRRPRPLSRGGYRAARRPMFPALMIMR